MSTVGLDAVLEAFSNLHMPDPSPILVTLAAAAAARLEGPPVHLFLIGAPATGKNEILESLFGLPKTYHVTTFNESSLLSATKQKERASFATGGILMEVGIGGSGRIIMTEFNAVLSMHPDRKKEALSALQQVCTGLVDRSVGVDGATRLHWDGRVQVMAACTETIEGSLSALGAAGERFVYVRMPTVDRKGHIQAALKNARNGTASTWKKRRAQIVPEFLDSLYVPRCPEELVSVADESRLGAIADFVTLARSPVARDHKKELELVMASEGPARMVYSLQRLLCGMRMIGVKHDEALGLLSQASLGSLPSLRRTLIKYMARAAEGNGSVTVAEIREGVPYSDSMVRRALEDLEVHGIVQRTNGHLNYWSFTDDALDNWCLGFTI